MTAIVKAPILSVLGNHDYEAGEAEQVRDALGAHPGVRLVWHVLSDGTVIVSAREASAAEADPDGGTDMLSGIRSVTGGEE